MISFYVLCMWCGQVNSDMIYVYANTHCKKCIAFAALPVYAISGHDWCPTLLTLGLGLVPVGTNMVSISIVMRFILFGKTVVISIRI